MKDRSTGSGKLRQAAGEHQLGSHPPIATEASLDDGMRAAEQLQWIIYRIALD